MNAQSIEGRMAVLQDLRDRILKKLEVRAADPEMQNVPAVDPG